MLQRRSRGSLLSIQDALELSGRMHRTTSRASVRSQQTRKLCLLQNQPLIEAPGAAAPLVLEVDPMRPRTGVPKGVPEHREVVAFRGKPNDVFDTDPFRISALKPVRDA